jgi:tripartite ATP-independent transporter DctM subunit
MVAILLVVSFLLILTLGVPISLGMGLSAGIAMFAGNYNLAQIPVLLQKGMSNYGLVGIPYFILAANIMNTGGITTRIYDFCDAVVGWMRGGLAQVNVLGSVIFAGISGSSSADAAGLGLIEITAMREKGYDLKWSTGITLASSLLGPIIPPSIAFIQFALLAEVSATDLFIAGIIPGVVIALILMIMNHCIAVRGKVACPAPTPFKMKIAIRTFIGGFFALLAPAVLMVSLFSGAVTATEVGIIAVVYAVIAAAIYKELKFKNIVKALYDTVISSAVIMFLVGFGNTIGWVLTIESMPQMLTNLIISLTQNKYFILFLVNVLLLILGMFLDNTTIRIITVPLLLPLIDMVGIDRIHFGIVHTLNCLIGTCTPPVGVGLMIMTSVTKQKFTDVVRGVMPFLIPLVIALLILTYIPVISTWLPNLLK